MNAPIDIRLTNDFILLSVSIQIICDEFTNISSRDLYLRCRMNVATDYVQPMSHGIPTIDTLDGNVGIWRPATRIIITLNITHGRTFEHSVGQGTAVGGAVGDYREEKYKPIL